MQLSYSTVPGTFPAYSMFSVWRSPESYWLVYDSRSSTLLQHTLVNIHIVVAASYSFPSAAVHGFHFRELLFLNHAKSWWQQKFRCISKESTGATIPPFPAPAQPCAMCSDTV
jgi:hypothetical protein